MVTPKITKTLALDQNIAQAIEKIACQEKRSFTKTVEIILEAALQRQQSQKTEKETA